MCKAMLCVLILLSLSMMAAGQLKLQTVKDLSAKCLDGSQASYYFAPGYGDGSKRFLIYFQGGGWLVGNSQEEALESAYQRSQTFLGSSTNLDAQVTFTQGILSRDQTFNNDFYNWNTIHINYCDGTGHQGFRKEPINYKGKDLYFRGNNNVKAIIKELQDGQNLMQTDSVVLSGCSAGGVATFIWANYFGDLFDPSVKYRVVPDSGIFIVEMKPFSNQYPSIYRNFHNEFTYSLSNAEVDPVNSRCVAANPDIKEKCLLGQYLIDYMDYQLFIVQSQYDGWSIPNILQITCTLQDSTLDSCTQAEIDYIEDHRTTVRSVMKQALAKNANWGVWSPSCINHCYEEYPRFEEPGYSIPQLTDMSLQKGIRNWMQNKTRNTSLHIDEVKWPFNGGCSNEQW